MPITIAEIAAKAGVSRSTVSRALKDHPNISLATRQRVRRLAAEMGYVPNLVAQSLSNNRTQTLGMVITRISDPFVWQVVEGVEQAAHDHGYSVFFSTSRNDADRERSIIETFQQRRVDGVVVNSSHMGSLYSARLRDIQIPVVLINNQHDGENLHSVSSDDRSGACIATEYLLRLGHRKIVYLAPVNRVTSSQKRLQGYRAALQAAGISPPPEWIIKVDAKTDFDSGRCAAQNILDIGASAVFCYNDTIALGLITTLHNRGVHVPNSLSVIGFDDIDAARNAIPSLTTMKQPMHELGGKAVMLLLNLLNDRPVEDLILPCELIERGSTRNLEAIETKK